MRNLFKKSILIVALVVPLASYADTKSNAKFQIDCNKAWMDMAENTADKLEYKNFGEKFCECAAGKSLATKDDVDKTAQICMSQTLLHDTMDTLEDNGGLDNLTDDKVQDSCKNKWKIIYPNMNDNLSESVNSYCQCVSPKLMDLNKQRDDVTDKQWYEKMNVIAADCSGKVEPEKTSSHLQKSE